MMIGPNFFRINRHKTSLSRFRCRFSIISNIRSTQQLLREEAWPGSGLLIGWYRFWHDVDAASCQNFTRDVQLPRCYSRPGWLRSKWTGGVIGVTTSQMALCWGTEGRRRRWIPSGMFIVKFNIFRVSCKKYQRYFCVVNLISRMILRCWNWNV